MEETNRFVELLEDSLLGGKKGTHLVVLFQQMHLEIYQSFANKPVGPGRNCPNVCRNQHQLIKNHPLQLPFEMSRIEYFLNCHFQIGFSFLKLYTKIASTYSYSIGNSLQFVITNWQSLTGN